LEVYHRRFPGRPQLDATAINFFELGLLLGALVVLAVFGAPILFWARREPLKSVPLAVRQAAEQRLLATPRLQTVDTAARIYDAVQEVVTRSVDANKSLETKASGVIVLSSAVLGFGAQLANAHRAQPWLAILASLALVCAIVCAARVNFSQAFNLPSPITYNLPSIANLPDNEAKIVLELTEAWNDYAVDERTVGVEKALWLRRSFAAMLLGVTLFVLLSAAALVTDASSTAGPMPTPTAAR
jgi:hypothetical protein